MAYERSFKELRIWKTGMELCVQVYQATADFPRHEVFGLRAQMRRAAVSVPSNIAEGWGRNGAKSLRQFCLIARGSLLELQTQVDLSRSLGYFEVETATRLSLACETLSASLHRFVVSLPDSVIKESTASYGEVIDDEPLTSSQIDDLLENPLL